MVYRPRTPKNCKSSKAGEILRSALKNRKLDQRVLQYQFVEKWPAIVGEELQAVCKPAGIRGTSLGIAVPSSVWSQELAFCKDVILKRLQPHLLKDQVIDDLYFVVDSTSR